MTTPTEGVNDTSFTEDEAISNLMSRWQDADKPSDDTDKGNTSGDTVDENLDHGDEDDATELALLEAEESDENTDEDEGSDTDQSDVDESTLEAGDDHRVSLTVDGETKTVTVKELKRLFGQEASLTRKSQEVAAARKAADAEGERYIAAMQRQIEKAEGRFAPFAKIDWMVAQQRLTPAEFSAMREEAREAHEELSFLKQEADEVLGGLLKDRQAQAVEAAKAAITVLERDIPGWNREVYEQVRDHAVSNGMEAAAFNNIVDPSAIKMMHDAMKYRQLKEKAAAKRSKPKAAPKKVVRPASKAAGNIASGDKASEAKARLRKTGSTEDAVAALMAGWADSDND